MLGLAEWRTGIRLTPRARVDDCGIRLKAYAKCTVAALGSRFRAIRFPEFAAGTCSSVLQRNLFARSFAELLNRGARALVVILFERISLGIDRLSTLNRNRERTFDGRE